MFFVTLMFSLIALSSSSSWRPQTNSTYIIRIDSNTRNGRFDSGADGQGFEHKTGSFVDSAYIYHFRNNRNLPCNVKVHFTDFDLPFGSVVKTLHNDTVKIVYEESTHSICSQNDRRPLTLQLYIAKYDVGTVKIEVHAGANLLHNGFKGTFEARSLHEPIVFARSTYRSDCPRLDLTRTDVMARLDTTFDCVWVVCTSAIRTRTLSIVYVTENIHLMVRAGNNSEGAVLLDSTKGQTSFEIRPHQRLYVSTNLIGEFRGIASFQVILSRGVETTTSMDTSTTSARINMESSRRKTYTTESKTHDRSRYRRSTTRRPDFHDDWDSPDWNYPDFDEYLKAHTTPYPFYWKYKDNSYTYSSISDNSYTYSSSGTGLAFPLIGAVFGVILLKVCIIFAYAQSRKRTQRRVLLVARSPRRPASSDPGPHPEAIPPPPAVPDLFHQDDTTSIVTPPTYEEVMEESRLPSYTEVVAEGVAAANGDDQDQEEKDNSERVADEPDKVDVDDRIPILANPPTA